MTAGCCVTHGGNSTRDTKDPGATNEQPTVNRHLRRCCVPAPCRRHCRGRSRYELRDKWECASTQAVKYKLTRRSTHAAKIGGRPNRDERTRVSRWRGKRHKSVQRIRYTLRHGSLSVTSWIFLRRKKREKMTEMERGKERKNETDGTLVVACACLPAYLPIW